MSIVSVAVDCMQRARPETGPAAIADLYMDTLDEACRKARLLVEPSRELNVAFNRLEGRAHAYCDALSGDCDFAEIASRANALERAIDAVIVELRHAVPRAAEERRSRLLPFLSWSARTSAPLRR